MTDKAAKYLSDIQYAATLIERFLEKTTSFTAYQSDLKTQSAVERQLGIIGEAANKFRQQEEPTVTLNHTKQIVNLRNRIIHSYDSIDAAIIWAIVKNHLPDLKQEVEQLLKS